MELAAEPVRASEYVPEAVLGQVCPETVRKTNYENSWSKPADMVLPHATDPNAIPLASEA